MTSKEQLSDSDVRAIIIALATLITAEGGGDIKFKAKKD